MPDPFAPMPCEMPETRATASPSVLFGVAAVESADGGLDASAYLVRHRAASFYFTVEGDSMCGAGILDGDKVLVDRAVAPKDGHIVVAVVNGAYLLRRLHCRGKRIELHADHPGYAPMRVKEGAEWQVWGVVAGVLRRYTV